MGILSYRIYKYIENKKILDNPLFIYPAAISLVFLFTLTIFYPFQSNLPSARSIYLQNVYQVIPGPVSAKWIYLTSITLIGPILFLLARNSKYDRFLGDLSYPVFLCHYFFIHIIILVDGDLKFWGSESIVILSILFSLVLLKYIINPIDVYRQRRLKL
jgi:peptidoglycan/LPS O-acetylase OafA/YrhL